MNTTINNNIPITFESEIISKIKKMITEGLDKLKSFVKIKLDDKTTNSQNFEFYNELDSKFDEISFRLKELKLCKEYNYFLSISDYILYIVHQNSINPNFGHCDFALELLDFFMELFKTNLKFYNTPSEVFTDKFESTQKKFKETYWNYRYLFYCDIYEPSGEFSESEMYNIHKHLRG